MRACLKIPRGAVFAQKAGWRGVTKETAVRDSAPLSFGNLTRRAWEAHTPRGSSTEEQRSQTAFCARTLRAVGLLALAGVSSVVTAGCGDAPPSPPWPKPKSPAAAPLAIFREALSPTGGLMMLFAVRLLIMFWRCRLRNRKLVETQRVGGRARGCVGKVSVAVEEIARQESPGWQVSVSVLAVSCGLEANARPGCWAFETTSSRSIHRCGAPSTGASCAGLSNVGVLNDRPRRTNRQLGDGRTRADHT